MGKKYCDLYVSDFFLKLKDIEGRTESKGKFDIYCRIKKHYRMEGYIQYIKNNQLKKHISGIRCASNIMPINILRKCNIKREERFCNMCNEKQIGNELHIIMYCKNGNLVKLREKLLSTIDKTCTQFEMLSKEDQLTYMLLGVDKNITIHFAYFLNNVYKTMRSENPKKKGRKSKPK